MISDLNYPVTVNAPEGLITEDYSLSEAGKALPDLTLILAHAFALHGKHKHGSREVRRSHSHFLSFVLAYNKLSISDGHKTFKFEDLNKQKLISFYNYLYQKESPNSSKRLFGKFRHSITELVDEYPGLIKKSLAWPNVGKGDFDNCQPLDDIATNELFHILKGEIDQIYNKSNKYEDLIKDGVILETSTDIFKEDYSLKNICWYFKYKLHEPKSINTGDKNYNKIISILSKLPRPRLTPAVFIERYYEMDWGKIADTGRSPHKTYPHSWNFKLNDLLVTFNDFLPDYPVNTDMKPARDLTPRHKDIRDLNCGEISGLLLIKWRLSQVKPAFINIDKRVFWNDLPFYKYPSSLEIWSIYVLLLLQTGWNQEVLLNIDLENFEHPLSQVITKDTALITGTKSRSQGQGKPYKVSKEFVIPSSISDPYSPFNLLNLLRDITEPLRNYLKFKDSPIHKEAFIFLYREEDWRRKGDVELVGRMGRLTTNRGIGKRFLKCHEIIDHGDRLTALDLRRIRPTWFRLKEREGVSKSALSMMMGHNNQETTDQHYDSSPVTTFNRRQKLANELNEIVIHLKHFQGALRPDAKLKMAPTSHRIGQLFADDNQDRLIAICEDMLNPTWPGHEKHIKKGQVCRMISKCLQCKQATITRDTLPYLIDRQVYIDDQERALEPLDFSNLYGDERACIQEILDSWPNSKEIELAEQFQATNAPLFPTNLNIIGREYG